MGHEAALDPPNLVRRNAFRHVLCLILIRPRDQSGDSFQSGVEKKQGRYKVASDRTLTHAVLDGIVHGPRSKSHICQRRVLGRGGSHTRPISNEHVFARM